MFQRVFCNKCDYYRGDKDKCIIIIGIKRKQLSFWPEDQNENNDCQYWRAKDEKGR